MDSIHNRAVLALSVNGAPGYQLLDLNSNTFGSPIASPDGAVSEDPVIDPFRNLLLSGSEDGNFEIANLSNPANPAFYENATGGGALDSTAEDCSTGIASAPAEGSNPSNVFVADLSQASFTSGSPAGTWSAPSQVQTLSESSLSAGASAAAVAQGTHTGVIAGEFGGNEITAIELPSISSSGTPTITDWVFLATARDMPAARERFRPRWRASSRCHRASAASVNPPLDRPGRHGRFPCSRNDHGFTRARPRRDRDAESRQRFLAGGAELKGRPQRDRDADPARYRDDVLVLTRPSPHLAVPAHEVPDLFDRAMTDRHRRLAGGQLEVGEAAASNPQENANIGSIGGDGVSVRRQRLRLEGSFHA
jgi:hypothetical protein